MATDTAQSILNQGGMRAAVDTAARFEGLHYRRMKPMDDLHLISLSPKMSEQALTRYIRTFLDQERMSVHTYMMLEKLRRNKGYKNSSHVLWDYFATERKRRPYIISEQTFKSYKHKLDEVLIYWDCTYVEQDSPFARLSGVCATRYAEIMTHLDRCPPTLYMFDRDYQWSLVRTDEAQNELDWNCLQIGEIGSRSLIKPASVFGSVQPGPSDNTGPLTEASKLVPFFRKQAEQL
jgi:hypothetical protein